MDVNILWFDLYIESALIYNYEGWNKLLVKCILVNTTTGAWFLLLNPTYIYSSDCIITSCLVGAFQFGSPTEDDIATDSQQ